MSEAEQNKRQTLAARLGRLDARVQEIDSLVSLPEVASDPAKMTALMRERGRLMRIVDPDRKWRAARAARREAEEILQSESEDQEMRALAETEAEVHGNLEKSLLKEIQERLLEREEGADATRVILEIRAGTGGEEAALFARDLYEMYCRYADGRGWRRELLSASPTDLGGFKEIMFGLEGPGVFRQLQFESGGHRVQRVPETEAQGRIHTSAATVAVMAEPEELERRAERAAERKSKIGSGDRSQRIRTYNFPQNRVTDHRIDFTAHNLDQVMQGNLDDLVDALLAADRTDQLGGLDLDE